MRPFGKVAVSYTHLDVYKRQELLDVADIKKEQFGRFVRGFNIWEVEAMVYSVTILPDVYKRQRYSQPLEDTFRTYRNRISTITEHITEYHIFQATSKDSLDRVREKQGGR